MADVVRARLNGRDTNMSRFLAERVGAEVLDEPTTNADGTQRGTSRASGRPNKPRTTVAVEADKKTAAGKSPAGKQAAKPAQNEKE